MQMVFVTDFVVLQPFEYTPVIDDRWERKMAAYYIRKERKPKGLQINCDSEATITPLSSGEYLSDIIIFKAKRCPVM